MLIYIDNNYRAWNKFIALVTTGHDGNGLYRAIYFAVRDKKMRYGDMLRLQACCAYFYARISIFDGFIASDPLDYPVGCVPDLCILLIHFLNNFLYPLRVYGNRWAVFGTAHTSFSV